MSKKHLDALFDVKLKDAKLILSTEGLPQSESYSSFSKALQMKAEEIKKEKEKENAEASKAKCYEQLMELKVSISTTFYEQLLCLSAFFIAFLYWHFLFVFFWRKEIGKKAGRNRSFQHSMEKFYMELPQLWWTELQLKWCLPACICNWKG